MTTTPAPQSDAEFLRDLATGFRWEQRVAEVLVERGVRCRVTPKTVRRDRREFIRHRDRGDLELPDGRTLGVKSRGLAFKGVDDFPQATVMLGPPDHWDAMHPKPVAFVIVSQVTAGMFVVPGYTAAEWERTRIRRGSITQPVLRARRALFRPFDDLVRYLTRPV